MRAQMIELTNMCLVYDDEKILVEEKKRLNMQEDLYFPVDMLRRGKVCEIQ